MSNKILFFAGSARKDSFNKKLAKQACDIAIAKGADATYIDLADFSMPIYDGDLEADSGLPDSAKALKQIFVEHKGLFIASPEYNSSFSPLLKNSLDWISRPHEDNEIGLKAFRGKVAALASTAPGNLGGLRGLVPLRMMLGNILVTVLPNQIAIPKYAEAFNDGTVVDEATVTWLTSVVDDLIAAVK